MMSILGMRTTVESQLIAESAADKAKLIALRDEAECIIGSATAFPSAASGEEPPYGELYMRIKALITFYEFRIDVIDKKLATLKSAEEGAAPLPEAEVESEVSP